MRQRVVEAQQAFAEPFEASHPWKATHPSTGPVATWRRSSSTGVGLDSVWGARVPSGRAPRVLGLFAHPDDEVRSRRALGPVVSADGTNEPTCGAGDFQAGLVVRTYCAELAGYANTPEAGATPVPGALFGIPGPPDDPRDTPVTSGASVSAQHLQSATDGKEIVVYTMSSDTVFAVSSDRPQDPARASLSVIAAGIQQSFPGATLQVRGHIDSRGSPDANQSLSERRAAAVADFFVSAGFEPTAVSSVGLGQTQPNYVEDTEVGRDQNRRIELVVRPS